MLIVIIIIAIVGIVVSITLRSKAKKAFAEVTNKKLKRQSLLWLIPVVLVVLYFGYFVLITATGGRWDW